MLDMDPSYFFVCFLHVDIQLFHHHLLITNFFLTIKQLCFSRINLTWYDVFLHFWILFAHNLFRCFHVHEWDWPVIFLSHDAFVRWSRLLWSHKVSWEVVILFLFSGRVYIDCHYLFPKYLVKLTNETIGSAVFFVGWLLINHLVFK